MIFRMLEFIKRIPSEIKWFWQRGRHGYSDRDLWSLDVYFADMISKSMVDLIRNLDRYVEVTPEFKYDLWSIAFGMRLYHNFMTQDTPELCRDDPEYFKKYEEREEKVKKTLERSIDLFKKHFSALWW